MDMYTCILTKEEAFEQDQKTLKILNYIFLIGFATIVVVVLFPYVSNAKEGIKNIKKEEFIQYGDKTFRKLYSQKDYRNIKPVKQLLKNTIKQEIKRTSSQITGTIEFAPLGVIDLNPILSELFSTKKKNETLIQVIQVEPTKVYLLLSQVVYCFKKINNYVKVNKIAFLSGGFLGFGLGELATAKKGFDVVKSFLDKRSEKKEEKENVAKKVAMASIAGLGGVIGNPLIILPIVAIIILKGRFPGPKTIQEFDELPEPIKPFFKKPNKLKRFTDYYIRPIYNLKTPLPYCVVGCFIIYFNKGKIMAFIANRDQYRSAFGEITSIMMGQLKNQFVEFVSFVKNTNTIFVDQLRTSQKDYNDSIKEGKDTLKEIVKEQKNIIQNKNDELKSCTINKEKLSLGYQECALRYNYAKDYFEQNLLHSTSTLNQVGPFTIEIDQNAKLQAERILPSLKLDITQETLVVPIPFGTKEGKKKDTISESINKIFKPSNAIYHEKGIFDLT